MPHGSRNVRNDVSSFYDENNSFYGSNPFINDNPSGNPNCPAAYAAAGKPNCLNMCTNAFSTCTDSNGNTYSDIGDYCAEICGSMPNPGPNPGPSGPSGQDIFNTMCKNPDYATKIPRECETAIRNCCVNGCTLRRGDSNCVGDCQNDAQNYCSGSGGFNPPYNPPGPNPPKPNPRPNPNPDPNPEPNPEPNPSPKPSPKPSSGNSPKFYQTTTGKVTISSFVAVAIILLILGVYFATKPKNRK